MVNITEKLWSVLFLINSYFTCGELFNPFVRHLIPGPFCMWETAWEIQTRIYLPRWWVQRPSRLESASEMERSGKSGEQPGAIPALLYCWWVSKHLDCFSHTDKLDTEEVNTILSKRFRISYLKHNWLTEKSAKMFITVLKYKRLKPLYCKGEDQNTQFKNSKYINKDCL